MAVRSKRLCVLAVAGAFAFLGACGDDDSGGGGGAPAVSAPGPWQRTETRETCENFNVTRSPFFGDMHVHTLYSVDAVVFNVLGTPQDAYRFARGEEIRLAPYDENGVGLRPLRLRRPLDFTAVTDHSEGFGVYSVCFMPGLPGYDSVECETVRAASVSADPAQIRSVFFGLLAPVVVSPAPAYPASVCGSPPFEDCYGRASLVWDEFQEIAEQFYDRSANCNFTSFVAYEYTANTASADAPLGANLHRNVIFRNDVVPDLPVTYVDQPQVQDMWRELRARCQEELPGCDWLAIPHNSNLSAGQMFVTENPDGSPMTAADAQLRAASEPLVEIYQHKGSSECRTGSGTSDEQCGFELLQRRALFDLLRDPTVMFPASSYVREALKDGLARQEELGVNPFQMGMVGATDTHNAIPGATVEEDFAGHSGLNDDTPELRLHLGGPTSCPPGRPPEENTECGRGRADDGPGGLAVVWAEENSRDALFAAMRRRETYATSGTRPIVRFFAGDYDDHTCDASDLAALGYQRGVPMGAEIGPFKGEQSPTFTVFAAMDPGEPAMDDSHPAIPGTPLQRIQIIKGWVDGDGSVQEKVFDVVGDPDNGAAVDLDTCTPTGAGFDSLCATWSDPDFDAAQRAFYYARVLENPTCRWSTMQCNAAGVDCSDPESIPEQLLACCDATVPKTHQERAWASPIWYQPEGMGAVAGSLRFGSSPGEDELRLEVPLGAGVAHDLDSADLVVTLRDDDVIYSVTVPAGTLQGGVYEDSMGSLGGLRQLTFAQDGAGPATLALEAGAIDLSGAERVEHMVEVEIRIGTYRAAQTRLWVLNGRVLETV